MARLSLIKQLDKYADLANKIAEYGSEAGGPLVTEQDLRDGLKGAISATLNLAISGAVNVATQDGDDVLLQLDDEASVRLANVQVSHIHADDFLFAA